MSTLTPRRSADPAAASPRVGPLGRLARITFRRRGRTVLAWLGMLVVAVLLSMSVGGDFTADYSAPGSDSQEAQTLLEDRFPSQAGDTVDVVVRADGGIAGQEQAVEDLLAELGTIAHVVAVSDPFQDPAGVSQDGTTLVAHLRLDVENPVDMPVADSEHMLEIADAASTDGFQVALGGQSIVQAEQGEIGSEGIGLAAAAIILLITFGSVVAAGLPIMVAIAGLAVSSTLTTVVISFVDAPDWSTSLATMMGIGIGIDYTLLMVTRFREWRAAGLDPEAATVATLDTAGRSVMVAGITVVISMLGLFAMGLSFMRGAAVVTILAVLVVMAASITLFPALLGYLGKHVDRLAAAHRASGTRWWSPRAATSSRRAGWLAWSRLVDRHRIAAALVGVLVLLTLASPFLAVRFGFPDAGNNREETSSRQAYDMLADGFGAGMNGPLLLVAEVPQGSSEGALDQIGAAVAETPASPRSSRAALNPDGDTAVITVVPTTGPQDSRDRGPRHHAARRRPARRPPTARGSASTSAASRRRRSTAPTTSPSGCRSSSVAWCCSRCCC